MAQEKFPLSVLQIHECTHRLVSHNHSSIVLFSEARNQNRVLFNFIIIFLFSQLTLIHLCFSCLLTQVSTCLLVGILYARYLHFSNQRKEKLLLNKVDTFKDQTIYIYIFDPFQQFYQSYYYKLFYITLCQHPLRKDIVILISFPRWIILFETDGINHQLKRQIHIIQMSVNSSMTIIMPIHSDINII